MKRKFKRLSNRLTNRLTKKLTKKNPIHNNNFENEDINRYISSFLNNSSLISMNQANKNLNKDLSSIFKERMNNIKPKIYIGDDMDGIDPEDYFIGDLIEIKRDNDLSLIYQIINRFNNNLITNIIFNELIFPLNYDINDESLSSFCAEHNLPIPIKIKFLMNNLINKEIKTKNIEGIDFFYNSYNTNNTNNTNNIISPFFESIDFLFFYDELLKNNEDSYIYINFNKTPLEIFDKYIYKITSDNNVKLTNILETSFYLFN